VGGLAPDDDRGWQRKFDDPIPLPNGRTFVTLHDPASYITALPKKGMVDLGRPTMFARIGQWSLNRNGR
jgi:hypothetical protein